MASRPPSLFSYRFYINKKDPDVDEFYKSSMSLFDDYLPGLIPFHVLHDKIIQKLPEIENDNLKPVHVAFAKACPANVPW